MTRATRGRTGRELAADRPTTAVYALVTAAAGFRVAAAFAQALAMPLLVVSASLWIAAFALFVIACVPMLLRPASRCADSVTPASVSY
jgi:uncharacterized protein involved in response to NO